MLKNVHWQGEAIHSKDNLSLLQCRRDSELCVVWKYGKSSGWVISNLKRLYINSSNMARFMVC